MTLVNEYLVKVKFSDDDNFRSVMVYRFRGE